MRPPRTCFDARVAGHLFVIHGDLTLLECNVALLPCDVRGNVVWESWSGLLRPEDFVLEGPYGARLREPISSSYVDVGSTGRRRVRLIASAGDHPFDLAQVVAGVHSAIGDLRGRLGHLGGRVKPLVALPLVGTGAGGYEHRRGALIQELLPVLRSAAQENDLDVALVLRDERDHAAVQASRVPVSDWPDLSDDDCATADRLGRMAAVRQLSLYLGAGVSVPLGLPDWSDLLTKVTGETVPTDLSGEQALELAQRVKDTKGRDLEVAVRDVVASAGCAPSHYLLAGLRVRENVTTNYDTAYERALDTSLGPRHYRVMTRDLAEQPHPWILKIHGDAEAPETIVLTKDDYDQLEGDHRALLAVVESLLLTSHLLFVGTSLKDPDFARAVDRVHKVRGLARVDARPALATVLALHPDGVQPHDGLDIVPMLDHPDDPVAARRLEIFLDRVAWAAATHDENSHRYLLDDAYRDLVDANVADAELRGLVGRLLDAAVGSPARQSRGWRLVEDLLGRLGARTA